ncbi:Fur-regulated basic protein FbpA [Bacillus sp. JJ1773]|uniref:Fur-regulated basic protein FbpA n=1 Tax=Bacillus sp. JJ1773 TaxID=3122965 RepID=UPI003000135F
MESVKKYHFSLKEEEKDRMIEQLLEVGLTKMNDGRQLYELNMKELADLLEEINHAVKVCCI